MFATYCQVHYLHKLMYMQAKGVFIHAVSLEVQKGNPLGDAIFSLGKKLHNSLYGIQKGRSRCEIVKNTSRVLQI